MDTDGHGFLVEVVPIAHFDRALSYGVPPALEGRLKPGSLVRIPIRGRRELGVVSRLGSDAPVPPGKLKLVLDSVQEHPVLPPDLMRLFRWIVAYYACGPDAVLETMIPAAIRRGMRPKTRRYLSAVPGGDPETAAELAKRAPKQAALLDFVRQQKRPVPRALVLKRLGISASACEALVAKGLLVESDEQEKRVAYDDDLDGGESAVEVGTVVLTGEQRAAVDALAADLDQGAFAVRLLHGVTGSGKTEVYLHAIEKVVAAGGSAIVLVPEVALAPQTVGRVRARLEAAGVETLVWHSHLSEGERYDAWQTAASGTGRVVVGARSAIFAPLADLRLIIVDEEHEPAYKQDEMPRYHGRDVAVYRASLSGAVCVLGSATPSLETLYNVGSGKYRVSRILNRVDDRRLPTVHVCDMRREQLRGRGHSAVSTMLADKLHDRFDKGEQSILFLNRRGYSTSMLCPDCGHVATCDHCSIPLTYHRRDQKLRCHLCGHERPAPRSCPECRQPNIRWRGMGTQRIEDVVAKILPQAKVVRMDTDSMSRRNLYRRILDDFRRGKIDVLVGTQMIAKGLDFPRVTLVGLIDADISLHIEDFRAAERTFQLIVQVSGRAGRGARAGEVVIQTYTPHSPPIQFARKADFDGFQLEELEQRREFDYPPYRHLIRHVFRGRNPEKVAFYIEQWAKRLEEVMQDAIEVRGPAPAPIEKLRDEYRFHLWYFCPSVSRVIGRIRELREGFKMDREVVDVIDVDAFNLS